MKNGLKKLLRLLLHPLLITEMDAYDAGIWAVKWRLLWRFLIVTEDIAELHGEPPEPKLFFYVLLGNVEKQMNEFYDATTK